jgi:hypothetical protein
MASPSEAEGVGWSTLVDEFRTQIDLRLVILSLPSSSLMKAVINEKTGVE